MLDRLDMEHHPLPQRFPPHALVCVVCVRVCICACICSCAHSCLGLRLFLCLCLCLSNYHYPIVLTSVSSAH